MQPKTAPPLRSGQLTHLLSAAAAVEALTRALLASGIAGRAAKETKILAKRAAEKLARKPGARSVCPSGESPRRAHEQPLELTPVAAVPPGSCGGLGSPPPAPRAWRPEAASRRLPPCVAARVQASGRGPGGTCVQGALPSGVHCPRGAQPSSSLSLGHVLRATYLDARSVCIARITEPINGRRI